MVHIAFHTSNPLICLHKTKDKVLSEYLICVH